MCKECGCSGSSEGSEHHSEDGHHHHHGKHETVSVGRSILEKNDRLAEQHRGYFRAKGILVLNVVSSPGSGKTTLIQATVERLKDRARLGVIVGDLATDNDAQRLRASGIPVVQVTTGTVCHLDSQMIERSLSVLDLEALDILIIENVGNLVCPASFDLGEDLRVVLLSVTEGEDKPLKYPPMFHSANVALLTKTDLSEAAGFDRSLGMGNLRRISHHATLFEVSSRTGKGMDAWTNYLLDQHQRKAAACRRPKSH